MAINPELITTIRVDQLPDETLSLTNLFPHTVGTELKSATIQELVDLVATSIGVSGGVGYLPISVTDGQQLPNVPESPGFFLCGAGTFLNINGFPNIICTENLNAIMSLTDHWELAVEIPINPLSGSVQSVTGSAVDNTDPLNPVINEIIYGVQNIIEGTNITVDNTDPANPIISATGGGGGTGTVTSIGLTVPSAFNVTPTTPITTSGTFAITGVGTTSEYIRGDGSLATFPTIPSGIVTGSGTINKHAKFTPTGTAIGDGMIEDDGTTIYANRGIPVVGGVGKFNIYTPNTEHGLMFKDATIGSIYRTGTKISWSDNVGVEQTWFDGGAEQSYLQYAYNYGTRLGLTGTNGTHIRLRNTSRIEFHVGNTECMRIDNAGLISIYGTPPTGTTSDKLLVRDTSGNVKQIDYPTGGGGVPYTGATQDLDLGTHKLLAKDLVINHPSGSGVAASITKGGNGEALTVVKNSGSGNAASITGGVTLIDQLHLTTDLADAYIASASTWNGLTGRINQNFIVSVSFSGTSPADNTTYYIGPSSNILAITEANRRWQFPYATTIRTLSIALGQSTAGTSEAVSVYLRNSTAGTETLVGTFTSNFTAATGAFFNFSGLNISIPNTTDNWTLKIVTPSWATNPAAWTGSFFLIAN